MRIPWKLVHWSNSIFLMGTLLLTLTAVPAYIWHFGLDAFQVVMFVLFFAATGLSITLGYHRLFSHITFKASWPVRLGTLIFGAAAFENSALIWSSDHRQHHKFVDQENDPYDISKGFFHAHIGWILFKLQPDSPLDNVTDLKKDRLVMWQHRNYLAISIIAGFILPAVLGWFWNGWVGALGGFLIAGVARVVFVQHMTFFINSLCHTIGNQPYSSQGTARDSWIMALFTFGEGYHNYHHSFQHDYRNGVKPWQFDPTKWCIWLLHKMGMAKQLRRVPDEKILLAEIAEQQRQLSETISAKPLVITSATSNLIQTAQQRLHQAFENWESLKSEYMKSVETKLEASREKVAEMEQKLMEASEHLREAIRHWRETHRLAWQELSCPAIA